MAEVIYDGPFPEVEVTDPASGRRYVAVRGNKVEVADDLAKSLCEQDTWRPASKKATPKAAQKAVEEGVDIQKVRGSGKDGAVTASDVAEKAAKEDK